jgi:hypothetical protein
VIRFQCSCGKTLVADAGDRSVDCEDCGVEVAVPSGGTGAALTPSAHDGGSRYDFDAELVRASRTRPSRLRKTPRKVDAVRGDEDPQPPPPGAPFDLEEVRRGSRLLGRLSWLVLVLGLGGAAWALLSGPDTFPVRCAAAVVVLVGAGTVFLTLAVLRETSRAVSGLADQVRWILTRLEE